MIFVPLVYFTILSVIFIKKRGFFDISVYASLMYVMTSAFAVIMYRTEDLSESVQYGNISIIPTFFYCALLTLSIIPLYRLKFGTIKHLVIRSEKTFNLISYWYIFIFIVFLVLHYDDIIYRLFFGNFLELRTAIYDEADIFTAKYSGVLGILDSLCGIFASFSQLMILFFFISLTCLKRKWIFNLLLLLSSTSIIFLGIMGIDRSKTFYYLIVLGMCVFFFWNHLSSKAKSVLVPVLSVIIVAAGFYLTVVTIGRFEQRSDTDSKSSVVSYMGQPYINFCYFWDNYYNPDGLSTRYMLPFINHTVFDNYEGAVKRQQYLEQKTNMQIGVFYTFLGSFMVDSNKIGMFLFLLIYLLVWNIELKRIRIRGPNKIYMFDLVLVFVLSVIPTCGCILYFYTSFYATFSILVVLSLLCIKREI